MDKVRVVIVSHGLRKEINVLDTLYPSLGLCIIISDKYDKGKNIR